MPEPAASQTPKCIHTFETGKHERNTLHSVHQANDRYWFRQCPTCGWIDTEDFAREVLEKQASPLVAETPARRSLREEIELLYWWCPDLSNIKWVNRADVLALLNRVPGVPPWPDEAMRNLLHMSGLGLTDAQIVGVALLVRERVELWAQGYESRSVCDREARGGTEPVDGCAGTPADSHQSIGVPGVPPQEQTAFLVEFDPPLLFVEGDEVIEAFNSAALLSFILNAQRRKQDFTIESGAECAKNPNKERPRAASGEQELIKRLAWLSARIRAQHEWLWPDKNDKYDQHDRMTCVHPDHHGCHIVALCELARVQQERAAAILPETGRAPELTPQDWDELELALYGKIGNTLEVNHARQIEAAILRICQRRRALVPPQETGRPQEKE